MTNPLQDYDKCARAYLRAKALLEVDNPDLKQVQQLIKTLTSNRVGMTIIRGEQGPELDSLVSGLYSGIEEDCRTSLVSLPGPLIKAFSQLDPETIPDAAQITNQRRTNQELRSQWLWTNNCALYNVVEGEVIFRLTRGTKHNLIFQNIEEAVKQLLETNNYIPKKEDFRRITDEYYSKDILRAELSKLGLQTFSDEFSYLEIDTANYRETLTLEQKPVVEFVFGSDQKIEDNGKSELENNLKMLMDSKIKRTKIYVLNPKYVKKYAPKDGAIARACRLYDFGNVSNFYAYGRSVDDAYLRLRGVPRIATDSPEQSEGAITLNDAADLSNKPSSEELRM